MGETDIKLCVGCKFWLWFEEERTERCSIKGCWEGSKFKKYETISKKEN